VNGRLVGFARMFCGWEQAGNGLDRVQKLTMLCARGSRQ
jgi:hypothetical protein